MEGSIPDEKFHSAFVLAVYTLGKFVTAISILDEKFHSAFVVAKILLEDKPEFLIFAENKKL